MNDADRQMRIFYPLIKMLLGVVCLILGAEYAYAYCVYEAATFGVLYIADLTTWLLAGLILFTEGLQGYLTVLRETPRRDEEDTPVVKLRASP